MLVMERGYERECLSRDKCARLSQSAEGCPVAFEEWEVESISQWKANALDRLVAAGTIRDIDRENVRFIVRKIVHPPERPDDPLPDIG